MRLLFKEEGFSKDFKELLGFVDADMTFRNIKPELRSATKEMIRFIGADFYDLVADTYGILNDDTPSELVEHVRYPIGLNAYRTFAPTNDLKHTNNGRLMRKTEKEVTPFENHIHRDDINQERKYYRALDDLLDFLEEEGGEMWKTSPANQKLKGHFINTTADFDNSFPINSRLLLTKLMPGIKQAEREHILPTIGKDRFEAFKSQIKASQPIEQKDEMLFGLIKDAVAYYALSWAMKRLTVTLFPEGVLQQYTSDRMSVRATKTPEYLQSQLADEQFNQDAEKIMRSIEAIISKESEGIKAPATLEDLDLSLNFNDDSAFAST